jgi:short-subunit dehydrogenase
MYDMMHILSGKQVRYFKENDDLKSLRSKKTSLKVAITGASRGLGKAMVKEFLDNGDQVCAISRTPLDIQHPSLFHIQTDIGSSKNYPYIFDTISTMFNGEIDMFLCNAGQSGGNRQFIELPVDKIDEIIKTNLIGTSLCNRYAFDIMKEQHTGGTIFNFTGAGSNGSSTPGYSIYGSTKAGILQLTRTLQKEWKDYPVDLHLVSPGMLFTDLLTENMTDETLSIISPLCSSPELVAHTIVPRLRNAYYIAHEYRYIKFLTLLKILMRMSKQVFNKKD